MPDDDAVIEWYRCLRKHTFATLREASAYAEHITFHPDLQQRGGRNPNIWPYQCPHCDLFHVGQLRLRTSRAHLLHNARRLWARTLPEQRTPSTADPYAILGLPIPRP